MQLQTVLKKEIYVFIYEHHKRYLRRPNTSEKQKNPPVTQARTFLHFLWKSLRFCLHLVTKPSIASFENRIRYKQLSFLFLTFYFYNPGFSDFIACTNFQFFGRWLKFVNIRLRLGCFPTAGSGVGAGGSGLGRVSADALWFDRSRDHHHFAQPQNRG